MGQGQQGRLVGGRYRLTAVVGRGGMGTVWRAYDEVLDRDVAVKEVLLPPGIDQDQQNILYQRTYREARASARLSHPGVVTVHDVVQEDGRPWIVMELVRARPLQEIVDQDGPLPPGRVAEIGQQLLEALNHAHAAGILHRDVKPSNVLITADGRAVLTDFGIAQMPGEVTLTQTGLVMGSPAYIAPERAQGDRAMPGSDLWALGATLYTAVEGRSPYERGDPMAALAATLTEDPPPPRRAGPLGPVIEGLLVRDPARRIPAAAALPLLANVAYQDSANRLPSMDAAPPQEAPQVRYAESPYAKSPYLTDPEETQRDEVRYGPQPASFDAGMADTVNDPPPADADAATLLESARYGPTGYGPYEQTWSAQPGAATQAPARPAKHGDERPRPKRAGKWFKNKRFFFGGVAFVVGAALIVGGLLLWPLVNGDNSGGGTDNKSSEQVAAPPPGYKKVSGGGFSLAVPNGWTQNRNNNSTFWIAPDRESFVQVDTAYWTGSSNQQAYRAEADTKRRPDTFVDYTQDGIQDTTYRGQPATDWEFTFTDAKTKTKIRAKDRFVRLGNQTFAIYFRTPDSQWASSAERLNVVYRTFQATP
jgi:serine/threonine protein kinase